MYNHLGDEICNLNIIFDCIIGITLVTFWLFLEIGWKSSDSSQLEGRNNTNFEKTRLLSQKNLSFKRLR